MTDAATIPDEPAAVPDPSEPEDDLDQLLDQYREEQPATPPEPEAPEKTPEQIEQDALLDHLNGGEARPEILSALQRLEAADQQRAVEQENADFARVTQNLEAHFDDMVPFLPPGYFKAALLDEVLKNEHLHAAWQNRGEAPHQLERELGRFAKGLHKTLSELPDRQATADRAAVTAAIRQGSGGSREAGEIDYSGVSKMTDAEFEQFAANAIRQAGK